MPNPCKGNYCVRLMVGLCGRVIARFMKLNAVFTKWSYQRVRPPVRRVWVCNYWSILHRRYIDSSHESGVRNIWIPDWAARRGINHHGQCLLVPKELNLKRKNIYTFDRPYFFPTLKHNRNWIIAFIKILFKCLTLLTIWFCDVNVVHHNIMWHHIFAIMV